MPSEWNGQAFEVIAAEASTPAHHHHPPFIKATVLNDRIELWVDGGFGGDVGAVLLTHEAARQFFTDALAALGVAPASPATAP